MSRPYHAKSFGKFDTTSFQEFVLSPGVFRRETASGFYPWGNVVSPRKRVAEGLCVAPRLFFMFLFLIPFTIRQHCIIYPHKFSTDSIPAYTHQIPNGISLHLFRDNLYIIPNANALFFSILRQKYAPFAAYINHNIS